MLFPGNSRWNPYLALGDKSSSEMTVRRNRFASVPPGYFSSTKGHSAIRKWSNYPASRAAVYAEDIHWPEYIRPLRSYDTTREENEIRRDVSSELIYTTNLMDDTYDVAAKSRNRDQALLRDANRALPSLNKYGNQVADRKTTGSLTSTRRFQIPRSPKLISPNLQRGPTIYPKLAPPMYKATTSVQPLGILTQLDWTSPLEKFSTPRRLPELTNEDDSSEISRYETPVQSARSSPERDFGTKPKRYKVRSKQKPMIGNYYRRHLHRPGRSVQYYPYLDNDSVASDNIGEVVSNGEYLDDNDYQTVTDAGDGEYYIVNRGRSPSPTPSLDYVPFGPRSKINFDSDDYKCQVPSMSDFVMSNYTSHEKDTNVDSEGSRIKHDLVFHDIVAHTAAKARDALTNVDLDEYDNASLVISVEGEYKDPVKGENLGFHYIARPLQLKGPMLAGPAMYASRASDSAFIRYMDDMRSFRAQIRNRLETGYKTLSEITSKYQSHSYPVIASSHRSFSKALSPPRGSSLIPRSSSPVRSYSAHSLPISNLRKRLEEIENKYRSGYGKRLDESLPDRLVVYPISEKGTVRSVTEMEGLPGHTKTVELYQGTAKTNELSTLEKINIKAALVGNKVEVLTPHRRRPKSTYAANKLRQLRREEREIETEAVPAQVTTGLKATTVTSVRY